MKSDSALLRRLIKARFPIMGMQFFLISPVFVPKDHPGIINCTFTFSNPEKRIGLTYVKRGIWIGKYV